MSFELGSYKELFGKRDDEDHLLVCHLIRKHLNSPVIVIVISHWWVDKCSIKFDTTYLTTFIRKWGYYGYPL